jgi:hypothetical protein
VDLRQFMPLRVTPGQPTLLGTFVSHNVSRMNNQWVYTSGIPMDLSLAIPPTGACYGLIYVDTDGMPKFLTGVTKNLLTLTLADIPAPIMGTIPVAAVRLFGGQTQISESRTNTDIIDLRWGGFVVGYTGTTVYHNQLSNLLWSVAGHTMNADLSMLTNKIIWGMTGTEDTNLYRSAADTLKTDDNLIIVQGLNLGTATGATAGSIKGSGSGQFTGDMTLYDDEKTITQRRNSGLAIPITDDFNTTPAGYGFAAAPFVNGTVNTASFASLLVITISTAGSDKRAFYYKTHTPSQYNALQAGGNFTYTGAYVGLRWDDGSDVNFVEHRLVLTDATYRNYQYVGAYRIATGTINLVYGPSFNMPVSPILRLQEAGTKWSNWSCSVYYGMEWGSADWSRIGSAPMVSGLTWTPTRVGIVAYDGGSGSTTERFSSDWIILA